MKPSRLLSKKLMSPQNSFYDTLLNLSYLRYIIIVDPWSIIMACRGWHVLLYIHVYKYLGVCDDSVQILYGRRKVRSVDVWWNWNRFRNQARKVTISDTTDEFVCIVTHVVYFNHKCYFTVYPLQQVCTVISKYAKLDYDIIEFTKDVTPLPLLPVSTVYYVQY